MSQYQVGHFKENGRGKKEKYLFVCFELVEKVLGRGACKCKANPQRRYSSLHLAQYCGCCVLCHD